MSIDPQIARAIREIASDRKLLRPLESSLHNDALPKRSTKLSRIRALQQLIAAKEKLVERLKKESEGRGGRLPPPQDPRVNVQPILNGRRRSA